MMVPSEMQEEHPLEKGLETAKGILVIKYDLRDFSKWGAAIRDLPDIGDDALKRVLAGGRDVLAELVENELLRRPVSEVPHFVKGTQDASELAFLLGEQYSPDSFLKVLHNARSQLTLDPGSPEKRLERLVKEHAVRLKTLSTDTNPRLVVAYSSDAAKHAVVDASMHTRLNPLSSEHELTGPAIKRAREVMKWLKSEGNQAKPAVYIDSKSLEAMLGLSDPAAFGNARERYDAVRGALDRAGLHMENPVSGGNGESYLIYGLTLRAAGLDWKAEKVRTEVARREREWPKYVQAVVEAAFSGGKPRIARTFFGIDFAFTKEAYAIFLSNVISSAAAYRQHAGLKLDAVTLEMGEFNAMRKKLAQSYLPGYAELDPEIARRSAQNDADSLLRSLKIEKIVGSTPGEAPRVRYALTEADRIVLASARDDVYAAAVILATTPLNHLSDGTTMKAWTDGVFHSSANAMLSNTDIADCLLGANDAADVTRSRLTPPDLFETLLLRALKTTDDLLLTKHGPKMSVYAHGTTPNEHKYIEGKLKAVEQDYVFERAYLRQIGQP